MIIPETNIFYTNCFNEKITIKVQFSPDELDVKYVEQSLRFLKKYQSYLDQRTGLFNTDFLFRLMPIGIVEKKNTKDAESYLVVAKSYGYKSKK